MTSIELSNLLREEIQKRSWTVQILARKAGVPYETARRAVNEMGSTSLRVTNQLLLAVERELVTREAQTPTVERGDPNHPAHDAPHPEEVAS